MSGSSGHLVIERVTTAEEPPVWPGQVFGEAELAYELAMQQYVLATQERQLHPRPPRDLRIAGPTRWRQEWEARAERHAVLERRKQEDGAWRAAKSQQRAESLAFQQLPPSERRQRRGAWQAQRAAWRQLRHQRQSCLQARQKENQAWHARNRHLKGSASTDPRERSWLAILVVTDNCTRQCLGLPLFRSGPKVTSQEVIGALRDLLPAGLKFLISDQGKHFHTKTMALLAEELDFTHVLVYRHRPESNGIAERFVLTLKRWLRRRSWASADELEILLKGFQPDYNNRPHQGLGIPGLSPNEFANRIWLM